jgi:hypothetical protein
MGIMDKVGAGLEQAVWEVEHALDRGKNKAGELQTEMQMDGLAKKLGYLVFDFYRGRTVDQTERQKVLDQMSALEDKLFQVRAAGKAKAEADAQERAARKQQSAAPGAAPQAAPADAAAPAGSTTPAATYDAGQRPDAQEDFPLGNDG